MGRPATGRSRGTGAARRRPADQRAAFLDAVYRHSAGSTFDPVEMWEVGRKLGLSDAETRRVVQDLLGEGLIVHPLIGRINLTPEGLARAQAQREERRRPAGRVFVSYSRRDVRWLRRLRAHLAPLERARLVDVWDDRQIDPGTAWEEEIRAAIAAARVAVLLVSEHFLTSDFIVEKELPPLLAAAGRGRTSILPLLLRPSSFERIPGLGGIQAFNPGGRPLSAMRPADKDQTLVDLAAAVARMVGRGSGRSSRRA